MDTLCLNCFEKYDSEYELCPHCGYIPGAPAEEVYYLAPGTVLCDRYIIGGVLGFGGFGITYKAWDKKLETKVAIKEFYPSGIVNRTPDSSKLIILSGKKKKEFDIGFERFINEARLTAKFNYHKNIVHVFEYFEENNTAYIVMEFLDGLDLEEYIGQSEGKLSVHKSVEIILCIINALKDLHKQNLIHRDISLDNIKICYDGRIKLMDLGAAKLSVGQDEENIIILKPGFSPPEQYDQVSKQGRWTDVYALGATLYYMITGEKPDESTNRKIEDTLVEPINIDDTIPQSISNAVMKAMAIEPHMRFSSVDDFEKAITSGKIVDLPEVEKKKRKRKRLIGLVAAFAVVATVLGVFLADVNARQKDVVLQPASIVLWYKEDGNEAMRGKYEAVVNAFCAEYQNVKVSIVGIDAESYESELSSALHTMSAPNIFISDDLEEVSDALGLTEVVYGDEQTFIAKLFGERTQTDCLFLDDYSTYFPNAKKLPIGFSIPVLYINDRKISVPDGDVSVGDASDVLELVGESRNILVNPEWADTFKGLFGDLNIEIGTREEFLDGSYAVYFSDSSEFVYLREMVVLGTGRHRVIPVKVEQLPAKFSMHWSIRESSDEAQNEAAKRLLEFFLSNNAQSTIFLNNGYAQALPLDEKALSEFGKICEDFAFVEDDKNTFDF